MPLNTFTVTDVRNLIGGDRLVDVIDTSSHQSLLMTLDQFCKYFQNVENGREKKRILNVISLEFSHTRLDPLIEPPAVVKNLDWINKAWPNLLRNQQTDSTNDIKQMMYPKVQKYCLMSVAGCYTDFHLDFGGTSVWYHILKGEKMFFLIPPSIDNYTLFSHWQKSGKQECVFFPDLVKKCSLVKLNEGDTLMLPSGM
jgi:F-box/leucine-rich repeat protein 10/11